MCRIIMIKLILIIVSNMTDTQQKNNNKLYTVRCVGVVTLQNTLFHDDENILT